MSIVLNEYEWAERALQEREFGSSSSETLIRVAKYYYANHYTKRDVVRMLEQFILQCDSRAILLKWEDRINTAAKYAAKHPPVMIDGISISGAEMERISALSSKPAQRLAFTLLCIAKYKDATATGEPSHWVNTPDNEIMQMANIRTSIRRQSAMYAALREAGLIRFSKKIDNLSVQVLFIEGDDTAAFVRDFRNLGYQCMKYFGGDYFECECCGLTVKGSDTHTGRPRKYCQNCAAEMKTRNSVNAAMRRRAGAA